MHPCLFAKKLPATHQASFDLLGRENWASGARTVSIREKSFYLRTVFISRTPERDISGETVLRSVFVFLVNSRNIDFQSLILGESLNSEQRRKLEREFFKHGGRLIPLGALSRPRGGEPSLDPLVLVAPVPNSEGS